MLFRLNEEFGFGIDTSREVQVAGTIPADHWAFRLRVDEMELRSIVDSPSVKLSDVSSYGSQPHHLYGKFDWYDMHLVAGEMRILVLEKSGDTLWLWITPVEGMSEYDCYGNWLLEEAH